MKRKEMIETIAKQAGCSKRLVRKKLFKRAAEMKRFFPMILFHKVFLNENTDWTDYYENDDFLCKNQFEVLHLPSGYVVLFNNIDYIDDDAEMTEEAPSRGRSCGVRLYNC